MKNKITKNFILLIIQIVIVLISYEVGYHFSYNAIAKQANIASMFDELRSYVLLRDVALNLKSNRNDFAKCITEMNATNHFETLKICLQNKDCRAEIFTKVKVLAPEILGEKNVPINFTKECKVNNS